MIVMSIRSVKSCQSRFQSSIVLHNNFLKVMVWKPQLILFKFFSPHMSSLKPKTQIIVLQYINISALCVHIYIEIILPKYYTKNIVHAYGIDNIHVIILYL